MSSYNEHSQMLSQNVAFNGSTPHNVTGPANVPPNSVSWQSAFWPVVACTLTVMLQDTGRVCGGHYRDSYALRSSPFVCIVDTVFMLVKFVWMLAVGCSFRVAAMHVWYDRFEQEPTCSQDTVQLFEHVFHSRELCEQSIGLPTNAENGSEYSGTHPGSTIDRAWRLGMVGFILGALPQGIKIFSMRGIPLTQTLIAFLLISFLVPEIFRLIASQAGAVNLSPSPIVSRAKEKLARGQITGLIIACVVGWMFCHGCLVSLAVSSGGEGVFVWRKGAVTFIAFVMDGLLMTQATSIILNDGPALLKFTMLQFERGRKHIKSLEAMLSNFKVLVSELFAIDRSRWGYLLIYDGPILPFLLVVSTVFLCHPNDNPDWDRKMSRLATSTRVLWSLAMVPILLRAFYTLFRLVFKGSLSKYPRYLFGLEGLSSEYISGAFVVVNLLYAFFGYAYHESFSKNTYKPGWAEYLG